MPDISLEQGKLIVAEAKTWKGTPYMLVGGNSEKGVKGDCSGTTFKIYQAAGFPYEYQMTVNFPDYAVKSGKFRKMEPADPKQEGDVLWWPGHMAIYTSFADDSANATTPRVNKSGQPYKQMNDMWTASNPNGGPPYGPGKIEYFRKDKPTLYRYQVSN
ncbi:hypothetical protein F183_A43830 [Bryobacterales bacterium F-183]|nr:hypothetical protein F183_A43830 [Bryobacterales bacterium F-183]